MLRRTRGLRDAIATQFASSPGVTEKICEDRATSVTGTSPSTKEPKKLERVAPVRHAAAIFNMLVEFGQRDSLISNSRWQWRGPSQLAVCS